MGDNRGMSERAALLVTDSYKSTVNGISVFSLFFADGVLVKQFATVIVFETGTGKIYPVVTASQDAQVTDIYVNAHFSASDSFARSAGFRKKLRDAGIALAGNPKRVLISHGWASIPFRLNYYSIYYALKNLSRSKDLKRVTFYDEVIFISDAKDNYRHSDYGFCLEQNIPVSHYDFSSEFIEAQRKTCIGLKNEGYGRFVLVIANFEMIKNLWWLIIYNMKRAYLRRRKFKPFIVLVNPQGGMLYKIFAALAKRAGIRLVHSQESKMSLLGGANYLFIPSFSEYNPVVALEAAACEKQVVSLYPITALKKRRYYHSLEK